MEHERTSSGPRPTGKSKKISKSHVNSGKAHSFGTHKKSSWDKVYISFREIRLIQDQASWFISAMASLCQKITYWGVVISLIFTAISHRALIQEAIITIVTFIQDTAMEITAIHNQQMGNQNMAIQYTPGDESTDDKPRSIDDKTQGRVNEKKHTNTHGKIVSCSWV